MQAKLATGLGTIAGPAQRFTTGGAGVPGAVGVPPTPTKVTTTVAAKRSLHRVRVRFSIGRKWKVRLVVHRGGVGGPAVASVFRKFHKGANTVVLRFRGPPGAYTVTITPRAAGRKQTFIRQLRVA